METLSRFTYETMKSAFTAVGGILGRHSGEGRNPGV